MKKFQTKFVVYNQVPTDTNLADLLSSNINMTLGADGWELVSTSVIPTNGVPALLLGFRLEAVS